MKFISHFIGLGIWWGMYFEQFIVQNVGSSQKPIPTMFKIYAPKQFPSSVISYFKKLVIWWGT